MRLLLLASLLSLLACQKPGRVDLTLRASDELDLTTVDEIEVRLLEGDGEEVDRATVGGADLASLPRAFSKSAIDPGREYVFEIRAEVSEDTCATGRVVGRSLPVEVSTDEGDASSTMYVACADAVAPTGRLRTPRLGFGSLWLPGQRSGMLIGGTSGVEVEEGAFTASDVLDAIETYDVASGRFEQQPPLRDARWLAALLAQPEDRVLVLGGSRENPYDPRAWLDTVEELDGELRRGKGLLDTQWGTPSLLPMSDGTLAIVGVGYRGIERPLVQASFYDPVTGTVPYPPLERSEGGFIAVPCPGRDRALVVGGGRAETEPLRPALVCGPGACGCESEPCLVEIGDPDRPDDWGAGPGWAGAVGAWVSCPQGGGAAYVIGGQLPGGDPLDEVWCHHDDGGAEVTGTFERVGAIRHARATLDVTLVRGGRLFVVGGSGDGASVAELVSVSGCECSRVTASDTVEVTIDPDLGRLTDILLGHTLTVLGDGTVLIAGKSAVIAGLGTLGLEASDEAWIFNPDLP